MLRRGEGGRVSHGKKNTLSKVALDPSSERSVLKIDAGPLAGGEATFPRSSHAVLMGTSTDGGTLARGLQCALMTCGDTR